MFEDRRRKHRTDNPTSHRILFTTSLHKIPRGIRIPVTLDEVHIPVTLDEVHIPVTLDEVHTPLRTYMYTNYVLYAYLYCVYALVGGVISHRDPYICAVLRVCANGSHAVFHRPVV